MDDPSPLDEKKKSLVNFLRSIRFQICLMLFGCMFCLMYANLSMSVAILSMVNSTFTACVFVGHNSTSWGCERADHATTINDYVGKDDHTNWSAEVQGLVLSAISWGRLLSPVMSYLISKTDVSVCLPIGVLAAAGATALIPVSTDVGYGLVMLWRFIVGLSDAAVQPAISHLLANHFSPKTRNNAYGWTSAGRQFGVLAVYPIASVVSDYNGSKDGWPFVFYITSIICIVWVFAWVIFLLRQRRNLQKKASIASVASTASIKSMISRMDENQRGLNWRLVLTSGCFWSNVGAVLCHEIPLNTVMMFLPMYMRDSLHFCLRTNGVLSMLPIISFMVTKIVATQLDHTVKSVYRPDPTKAAKWFNLIASLGMGSFLLGVSTLNCRNRVLAVILLCCGVGLAGFHTPGCIGTLMSIAPSHSCSICSFVFVLISTSSILIPIVVKSIVTTSSFGQWQMVWQICAAIALLPVSFFTLFGTAKEQNWTKADPDRRMSTTERF
ncbi:transporter, major facilitator family [Trichuris trichiura]|uniref:Transporter, major facilitator family n=1 Tax=Trichuris trichiura TaxID=36087 RepID=A0A077ZDP5_TRITR|nr:transporter, major facilitator family [Trichuris trichiura]